MDQIEQQKLFDRAAKLLRSGEPRVAKKLCLKGLKKNPGDANLMCLSARANLALRKFPEAKTQLEEAIRRYPDFAVAHETLGDLLLAQGHAESGRKAYEQAMRLDPTRLATHDKIDRAKELEIKVNEAVKAQRAKGPARKIMPFDTEISEALEFERKGNPNSAEDIYRRILTQDPNHIEAARLLAQIAAGKKRFKDTEILLRQVLKNAPDYTRAWVDLSNAQREMGKFHESLESAEKVVAQAPQQAESHLLYAGASGMVSNHAAAITACERAHELSPDKPGPLCTMGHHQKTVGRQDDAVASYRRCIEVKPGHAESYWSLANLKTFRFEDAEVAAMESLLEEDELADVSRAQIHNALGLEYEGQKDYARAFENFEKCNMVQRKLEKYDPVDTETNYDRTIELFNEEFFLRNAGVKEAEVTPIFIVGLPRSGSTLIEQILASHSQVDATHELGDLSRVLQTFHRKSKKNKGEKFPNTFAGTSRDEWADIGADYLNRTTVFRDKAPFFVDKNPNNFTFAGFLKIAIPNAKIIDARRHPLDSCLGSYKQLFASGQPFSYDMTEIGEYYLQYRRLMEHWHKVLPGYVLDVQYENVVADLETQVRRILEFCGLPFEENCLHFHETERAVKTASSEQVRRPIYSSSVNLWRNYEENLETLVHILTPRLESLAAKDQPEILAHNNEK